MDHPTSAAAALYVSPGQIEVASPHVVYSPNTIQATYVYNTNSVELVDAADGSASSSSSSQKKLVVTPVSRSFVFNTERAVPRVGVMVVGWGGNNGSTLTASCLANRLGLSWQTKAGQHAADFIGSLTQSSTVRIGSQAGRDVYVPFSAVLPLVHPNDLTIGGWDISSVNLAAAVERAQVLDFDLQRQLRPHLAQQVPLPSIYYPSFIAANQADRADNLLPGDDKHAHLEAIRAQIRAFKAANHLDKVIVLWSANTERFCDVAAGLNDTAEHLLAAIARSEAEVSPSTVFAVASILEGCTYINGSPQNTFVPGVLELAQKHNVFIGGDDFKSGQTKIKSVLVDFLVSAGLKPTSIVSYNHLGNNDGKNLSSEAQFRSKEISKRNVVDDMVESNGILYKPGEHPDHVVVIKYVPTVGDSKRALDEYTSKIFMNGTNTIALHNTCEDSLLAVPLMIDLVVISELFERITLRRVEEPPEAAARLHSVLSLLSYMLKAPLVVPGTPIVNALFKQREALCNMMRACVGLAPENHMLLEHRLHTAGTAAALQATGLAAPLPRPLEELGGKRSAPGPAKVDGNGAAHADDPAELLASSRT